MAQHMPSIDLPRPPPSDNSADASRIPTPLSTIMQQQQQKQASTMDPSTFSVSSLRALALSTIRPKRKRDDSEAHNVSRRSSTQSPTAVTLDYGSDSNSKSPQDEVQEQSTSSSKQEMPPPPDSREEGEISDEEDIQSPPPMKTSIRMPPPEPQHVIQAVPSTPQVPPVSTTSSFMSLASDLPQQSVIRVNPQPQSPVPTMQGQEPNPWSNWVPTKDHVRPGLRSESAGFLYFPHSPSANLDAVNMEQFNLAKELILDLLGWGVSPEYLVDCGLTREAVFYTFSELNLRLPSNLDVSGLLPSSPFILSPS